jgi:phospholipid/cholesterol/gamma-HCH transport system ATP-binding protein
MLADKSFILAGGKVVASGETKALKNSSDELVRQFMNGLADGPVPFHYPAPAFREHVLAGKEARLP